MKVHFHIQIQTEVVVFLSQKIKDDLIPHDKTNLGEAVEILKKCNL